MVKYGGSKPGAVNAIMPDFHESFRKDMQAETPQEFLSGERYCFYAVPVSVILDRKTDMCITHVDNTLVTDSHPVGVLPQVFNYTIGRSKRRFTKHDPWFLPG